MNWPTLFLLVGLVFGGPLLMWGGIRLAHIGKREPNATTKAAIADSYAGRAEPDSELTAYLLRNAEQNMRDQLNAIPYLHDFGPNVPVEEPCFYENGQPVYWEKAP